MRQAAAVDGGATYYAHTPPGPGRPWHELVPHLRNVSQMARDFARPFGGEHTAYWAGLWHDLGKFQDSFQQYLRRCAEPGDGPPPARGPDHSSAGAVLASLFNLWELAFAIAGHHAGLPSESGLKARLQVKSSDAELRAALRRAVEHLREVPGTDVSGFIPADLQHPSRRREMFTRFVFSALVDADRLDTERHVDPEQAALRATGPSLTAIRERFRRYHAALTRQAEPTGVNRVRREVYECCLRAATLEPGLFRLTVPTGGGKTLSSLAFALEHAVRHDLRRVVVAIPFLSITEQTARVYRQALGDDAVIEHHSSVAEQEGEGCGPYEVRVRMAAENWDAPVIVTTTVQLFESLFSNRPGACRRLHRLARSVIIIDEVQTLPAELLTPILDGLDELTAAYGATVVLCTATQPAFDHERVSGLHDVREIVPHYREHFEQLRRVRYHTEIPSLTWEEVARAVRDEPQILVVVNTRKDALVLLDALVGTEVFHLSTLLCPAHRREVLDQIRQRLSRGESCRVVSTQVVEAGVDLDFPVVMRAVGPLESLVQAAGRCNREGRLAFGRVVIFEPADGSLPQGVYRTAVAEALKHLRQGIDLNDPSVFRAYFASLYGAVDLDALRIQECRERFDFPEVSRRFRLIRDDAHPVIVRYGEGVADLLAALRYQGPSRHLLRKLQPYTVNLYRTDLVTAQAKGLVRELSPGLWEWCGVYDPVCGLGGEGLDPESLVV